MSEAFPLLLRNARVAACEKEANAECKSQNQGKKGRDCRCVLDITVLLARVSPPEGWTNKDYESWRNRVGRDRGGRPTPQVRAGSEDRVHVYKMWFKIALGYCDK